MFVVQSKGMNKGWLLHSNCLWKQYENYGEFSWDRRGPERNYETLNHERTCFVSYLTSGLATFSPKVVEIEFG